MKIVKDELKLKAQGYADMHDITQEITGKIKQHGLKNGTVTVFVQGSTAGVTTIEHESGLVRDFEELMEKIIPSNVSYHHDARWGDGNGFSHIRASLLGPSLTIPFSEGRMELGTWQQVVFVDFDNRPRSRTVILQFMGE